MRATKAQLHSFARASATQIQNISTFSRRRDVIDLFLLYVLATKAQTSLHICAITRAFATPIQNISTFRRRRHNSVSFIVCASNESSDAQLRSIARTFATQSKHKLIQLKT